MTPTMNLMVSYPNSGFGIYLPDEARDFLGGYDTPVKVLHHVQGGGTVAFRVFPHRDGRLHIRQNGRGSRNCRVFWNRRVPAPIDYHFGPQEIAWEYDGDGISFVFPRKGELKAPKTKRRTVSAEPKKPLLRIQTQKDVDFEDAIQRQINALGELLKMLADPKVPQDVKHRLDAIKDALNGKEIKH